MSKNTGKRRRFRHRAKAREERKALRLRESMKKFILPISQRLDYSSLRDCVTVEPLTGCSLADQAQASEA